MIIIRTAEAFARLLATHPDPDLQSLLQAQADRLAEYADYTFEELALFAIVQKGDDLKSINTKLGGGLVDGETFALSMELIDRTSGWYEVIFILSDDGFGLVLYVPISDRTDRHLLTACERALS